MTPLRFICLGRNGDLLNAVSLAQTYRPEHSIEMVTSTEFLPLLKGFSWITPIEFKGPYTDLQRARQMHPRALVAQYYMSGAPQTQSSYQLEIWSMNNRLDKFGTEVLDLDNRNELREIQLLQSYYGNTHPGVPVVLVAGKGVSSPLPNSIFERLQQDLLGCNVVNLDNIQAERPFDMLALLDRADCIVSIDSFFLHLARASKCPVVSILNSGWRGSVPPPNSVAEHRYESLNEQTVIDDVARLLGPHGRTVLVVDDHGDTVRHKAARASWESQFDTIIRDTKWKRNATQIGNARGTPFIKDLLERALSVSDPDSVVFLTNSDTQLSGMDAVARHAHKFGAVSMRRDERTGEKHIGRELYAFSAEFLRNHLQQMPDMVCGYPLIDLAMARFIRSTMRIRTTGAPKTPWSESNLWDDIFPAELPYGPAFHPSHISGWNTPEELRSPAYAWNSRKWSEGWKNSY